MTRNPDLRLVTTTEGGATVVTAAGTLDIATVGQLEDAVGEAIAAGSAVVVDLSELSICDSTGLGAMVRLYRRAQGAGLALALRNPRRPVAEVLAMTGINKILPVESVNP